MNVNILQYQMLLTKIITLKTLFEKLPPYSNSQADIFNVSDGTMSEYYIKSDYEEWSDKLLVAIFYKNIRGTNFFSITLTLNTKGDLELMFDSKTTLQGRQELSRMLELRRGELSPNDPLRVMSGSIQIQDNLFILIKSIFNMFGDASASPKDVENFVAFIEKGALPVVA